MLDKCVMSLSHAISVILYSKCVKEYFITLMHLIVALTVILFSSQFTIIHWDTKYNIIDVK